MAWWAIGGFDRPPEDNKKTPIRCRQRDRGYQPCRSATG